MLVLTGCGEQFYGEKLLTWSQFCGGMGAGMEAWGSYWEGRAGALGPWGGGGSRHAGFHSEVPSPVLFTLGLFLRRQGFRVFPTPRSSHARKGTWTKTHINQIILFQENKTGPTL